MENLNRVLLENVLPAHVAEHFLARSLKNEVRRADWGCSGSVGLEAEGLWRGYHTVALHTECSVCPWSAISRGY